MCLLDEVIAWSDARVSCRSGTHREADNPLRADGKLGIACGIEYAAQAMAVHGALIAGGASTAGRRRGPRSAPGRSAGRPNAGRRISRQPAGRCGSMLMRLDDVQGDLICDAVRMAGDATTAVYEFELRSEAAPLLRGRATVVFDAGLQPSRRDG